MQKKTFAPRVGAAIMAASVMMSMGTQVMAAGTNYSGTIGGEKTTTFYKYLVMDQEAEVPNASFTFTVTAGEAKSYDVAGKIFEILAGVDAEKVTMAGVGTETANTIAYRQGDTTAQDVNAMVKNYDNTTEKYAQKEAVLDFTACQFKEPGIYRYIITESGTNQGITNDSDLTRIVDVYVEDDSDGTEKKLKIAGYVLHSSEDDSPDVAMGDNNGSGGEYSATKSQGFTNEYDTSDLIFRKEVSGNQASHDKYFEFTVKIANAVPDTKYLVNLDGADQVSGNNSATIESNTGKQNPSELVIGQDGSVTKKFYLQHGQEIKIQGLANNSTYEVTENAEDYKSAPAGVTGYNDAVNGTIASTDVNTSYLNTRDGIIPTGVIIAVAPFAAVTLLGGAGAVSIVMKKRKKDSRK